MSVVTRYATATCSRAITSAAARSPERTAPSTQPHMTAELSVPAQWMRPHGSRSAGPNSVSTPGRGGRALPHADAVPLIGFSGVPRLLQRNRLAHLAQLEHRGAQVDGRQRIQRPRHGAPVTEL